MKCLWVAIVILWGSMHKMSSSAELVRNPGSKITTGFRKNNNDNNKPKQKLFCLLWLAFVHEDLYYVEAVVTNL